VGEGKPRLYVAGLIAVLATAVACTEDLESSSGCPLLCVDPGGSIATVILDAVTLDTTVSALAGQGTESSLLVAARGDTLDSRAVIRFDSLPARFVPLSTDTTTQPITRADSVTLQIRIDTIEAKLSGNVTIDAYDVDTTAADSLLDVVASLFRPDRLIASNTFADSSLKDTVIYKLPSAAILDRTGRRLRIGLKARGDNSVQFRIRSTESGGTPTQLRFRVSTDTVVRPIALTPYSKTPQDQPSVALSLADYTILVKAPPSASAPALSIGGLPAHRVYMRFDLPREITDSVDIVRATLLLTQRPNLTIDATDTLSVLAYISLAGAAVTDVARASQIIQRVAGDTLKVAPQDSGLRTLDIAPIVAVWRAQTDSASPRAVVLLSGREGQIPLEARFFSIEADPSLRPRLRISYSTRRSRGLP
jgi:hypothetical protein